MLLKLRFLLLFLTLLFISSFYLFRLGGENNNIIINTLYLLPPSIAVMAGIHATNAYSIKTPHGKTFLLLTIGILCLLIGESIWYILRSLLLIDPFPSVADFFYLLGYPFLFLGLLHEIRLQKQSLKSTNRLVLSLIFLITALFSFIVFYFGVVLAYKPEVSVLQNTIAISYGITDLLLIIPCLFVLKLTFDYIEGKVFHPWMYIFTAIVFTLIGDLLFAIFNDQYAEGIWPYSLIDLTWILSYLCFANGFFGISNAIHLIHNKMKE